MNLETIVIKQDKIERPHIPELDGVRGLAVSLVLILHCVVGLTKTTSGTVIDSIKTAVLPFLIGGVDMFFILSGFLIAGILIDNRNATNYFQIFWTRRIARIFPVYYFVFASYFLLSFLNTTYLHGTLNYLVSVLDSGQKSVPMWAYALFMQNNFMIFMKNGAPFMFGVTWSVAIEEQFYLILPFLIFFLPRKHITFLAIVAIVLSFLIRVLVWYNWTWNASYLFTFSRIDALMMGVLIASIIRDPHKLAVATRLRLPFDILTVFFILCIVFNIFGMVSAIVQQYQFASIFISALQYPVLSLSMALCLLRLFTTQNSILHFFLQNTLLRKIGLVSYATYMFHQMVNATVHHLFRGHIPTINDWGDA
ncbi:MAG: acyltransferase [Methylococcales bacterium]|nr:acyltransferase [Methylococcales bacterium]